MKSLLRVLPALPVLLVLIPHSAHATGPLPLSGHCSVPLNLSLRADPDPGRPATAPPIPAGVVHIRVPLVPSARRSTHPMPQASYALPASWYRKDTRVEYAIPLDWNTARRWYLAAFTHCGFHYGGSGYSGNRSGVVSRSLSFGVARPQTIQITLSFERARAGRSLILYVASTITPPSPQILVPGSPASATISYYSSLARRKGPRTVVSIRTGPLLAGLIGALNQLPAADEVMSCPLDRGAHDTVRFRYVGRQVKTIDVSISGYRFVNAGAERVARSTGKLLRLLARLGHHA